MFNPLAQIKLISDELGKDASESKELGIIQALLLKFFFAFVLVFCIFVYLDKTSSLNKRSPELNKRIQNGEITEEEADKLMASSPGSSADSSSTSESKTKSSVSESATTTAVSNQASSATAKTTRSRKV